MSAYISEFQYYGDSSQEFIEIALPAGTDPSGFTIDIYDWAGTHISSFSLGASTGTMAGYDVYTIDASTPGFSTADPTGVLYPDDGIALVDGTGDVVQFLSYWGTTVTAVDGPAAGLTSSDVGTADVGESLQSDDGGDTYYAQICTNSGTIPACYAPGTMISTPDGSMPVEHLQPGDVVCGANEELHTIRWVWSGNQPLDDLELHQKPVHIQKDALDRGLPDMDLIVSGQHRIVVRLDGPLGTGIQEPQLMPAKALVVLPGVKFLVDQQSITWHHFACDKHSVVFANGIASESLLLGPEVLRNLSNEQRKELSEALGRPIAPETPALHCLTVAQAKSMFKLGKASFSDTTCPCIVA